MKDSSLLVGSVSSSRTGLYKHLRDPALLMIHGRANVVLRDGINTGNYT